MFNHILDAFYEALGWRAISLVITFLFMLGIGHTMQEATLNTLMLNGLLLIAQFCYVLWIYELGNKRT